MSALFLALFLSATPDCSQLKWCADLGGCFISHNQCVPVATITRDLECTFTSRCETSGLCSMHAGRCIAASDANCRQSLACVGTSEERGGRCTAFEGVCVAKREVGNAIVELSSEVRNCAVVVCGKVVLASGDRVPIGVCVVELDCIDAHYEERLLLKANDRVLVTKQKPLRK